MPTIFIIFGFVFKFFSDDHEPIHVHVIKDDHEAKYNVDPVGGTSILRNEHKEK